MRLPFLLLSLCLFALARLDIVSRLALGSLMVVLVVALALARVDHY